MKASSTKLPEAAVPVRDGGAGRTATTPLALPPLPYAPDALEPHMSRETLEYHHGRHHRAYVDAVNRIVAGTGLEGATLEEILAESTDTLFDNAAQAWNHAFFWSCLSPRATRPGAELRTRLERAFGSLDAFQARFTRAATGLFGSGWTWLVRDSDGTLRVVTTRNAGLPATSNQRALLACDVWEHAYYLDHRNDRGRYLEHFWALVDWRFVERNLEHRWQWPVPGGDVPDAREDPSVDSFPASDPAATTTTRVGPPRRRQRG